MPENAGLTPPAPDDLVGAWRLESYLTVGADGALTAGPLGPEPTGLLLYGADHHMAVSMMRTDPAPAATRFMGYAGDWRLDGRRLVHTVTVSSHAYLVGTDQVRDCALDGGLLTLTGSARTTEGTRRGVLTWRRADPADSADSADPSAMTMEETRDVRL